MKSHMMSVSEQFPPLSFSSDEAEAVRQKIANNVSTVGEGCWQLPFSHTNGYSNLSMFNRIIRGHRAAYVAFMGPIPSGMLVMHKCDNRACVNPNHLSLGSASDNTQDMVSKAKAHWQIDPIYATEVGRASAKLRVYTKKPKPQRKPHYHKITDDEVHQMRNMRSAGHSLRELASKFNCSETNVCMICNYKSRTTRLDGTPFPPINHTQLVSTE